MSWTPATSIGPRAAHPSTIRILSVHRDSTDLFRSLSGRLRPCWKGPFSEIRPSLYLPLDSSKLFSQHFRAPFACRTWRCGNPFPQAEMGIFCTILVQCKSFRCNTSGPPRMCCKQRTCAIPKSRRCNTYKKQGVGGHFLTSSSPSPRRRPSGVN